MKMFKPGEKIVYIDDSCLFENEENYLSSLSLYKIYTVKDYVPVSEEIPSYVAELCVHILETDNIHYAYRFISLKMYRKLKLKNIFNT